MPVTIIATSPRFPLGQIVSTRCAATALRPAEMAEAIQRHAAGDWGNICQDDADENALSRANGWRIFSAYTFRDVRCYVITEADRIVITILLPEEY